MTGEHIWIIIHVELRSHAVFYHHLILDCEAIHSTIAVAKSMQSANMLVKNDASSGEQIRIYTYMLESARTTVVERSKAVL